MVPVRKPGRPLSACPHPRDRPCSCGSVTAAIPKKQACRCGDNTSSTTPIDVTVQSSAPLPAESISPTRAAFKVQKASARPNPSRKPSFDITNFERMDMNSVNIVQFDPRSTNVMPIMYPNGYTIAGGPPGYGFVPQYANFQPQDYKVPMQPPLHISSEVPARMNSLGGVHQVVLDHAVTKPIGLINGMNYVANNATSPEPSTPTKVTTDEMSTPSNGNSCCATKRPAHSHSSSSASSISEPQEPGVRDCCSSKAPPLAVKDEPMSNDDIPLDLAPQAGHQMHLENGASFTPVLYPQYIQQGCVFSYPPTYGSFNNPLEPSAWKQSMRSNGPTLSIEQRPETSNAATFVATSPEAKDTVHTCHCGDGCQCIGCAAHPYNDATQNYVRSAYTSMVAEPPSGESSANQRLSNGSGGIGVSSSHHGTEPISSPKANTPSSSTSTNGEEQNLSASDFFFVNYSFPECGGDMESCPCGDDCKCLGCTIHNWTDKAPVE